MFLHGTIEDKRFITQTVLSNATYYDGKLDVELHPVFDTLFRLSKEHELKKSTIEPSESVDFTNKKHFLRSVLIMAGPTRLELATFCVTGRHSNQTELRSHSPVRKS